MPIVGLTCKPHKLTIFDYCCNKQQIVHITLNLYILYVFIYIVQIPNVIKAIHSDLSFRRRTTVSVSCKWPVCSQRRKNTTNARVYLNITNQFIISTIKLCDLYNKIRKET